MLSTGVTGEPMLKSKVTGFGAPAAALTLTETAVPIGCENRLPASGPLGRTYKPTHRVALIAVPVDDSR